MHVNRRSFLKSLSLLPFIPSAIKDAISHPEPEDAPDEIVIGETVDGVDVVWGGGYYIPYPPDDTDSHFGPLEIRDSGSVRLVIDENGDMHWRDSLLQWHLL
jgi:hypothetical protein